MEGLNSIRLGAFDGNKVEMEKPHAALAHSLSQSILSHCKLVGSRSAQRTHLSVLAATHFFRKTG